MKSWVAAFAFLVLAGQAHAQFQECIQPSSVPEDVYETILDQSSFDFGDLTEAVCESIVKKGVATCKAQVKAQAKCFTRSSALNLAIALKQCKQLEDAGERQACVADFKSVRDEINDNVEDDKLDGLAVCEGEFVFALADACALGVL
jgi:hypothetical protein